MKDRIIVGTPVKLSHVLIGIIVVIFLSLFLQDLVINLGGYFLLY